MVKFWRNTQHFSTLKMSKFLYISGIFVVIRGKGNDLVWQQPHVTKGKIAKKGNGTNQLLLGATTIYKITLHYLKFISTYYILIILFVTFVTLRG